VRQRAQERLLDEVVGPIDIALQRNGERTQAWHRAEESVAQGGVEIHPFAFCSAGSDSRAPT